MAQQEAQVTPHLTLISHSDNEHPQAQSIIDQILEWLKIAELATPIAVNIISAAETKTVVVPATQQPEQPPNT